MVGQRVLVPLIGVRVPVGQQVIVYSRVYNSNMLKIHHEGDAKKVFEDIRSFARNITSGKTPETGPLLLVGSGTQLGVFSGGGVRALTQLGLVSGFKTLVGVSTGAPVVSYFATGQANVGTEIYFGPNTGSEFINFRRALSGGTMVDLDWLYDKNICSGERAIDILKLKNSVSDIYYAVTRLEDAKGFLLPAKKFLDPCLAMKGSCAIPELYTGEVRVSSEELGENVRVVDGWVALPMPIMEAFEIRKPTSVLVFPNRPQIHKDTLIEEVIKKYQSLVIDEKLSQKFLQAEDRFWEEISFLKNSGVPYTIVWTDNSIDSNETDQEKLKQAADNFEEYILSLAV